MKKIIKDNDIEKFIIDLDNTIREAIVFFKNNNGLPLIVVNENKEYLGILSNGDIRRYLSNKDNYLDDLVEKAINKNAIYCFNDDNESVYSHYLFKRQIRIVPIVNNSRKLISVVYFGDVDFKISNYCLSYEDNQIYLIAEIGVNHNGDIKEAFKLIDYISEAGFNAVKMQFRSPITYNCKSNFDDLDLATEYIISELERTHISFEDEGLIVNYIKQKKLDFIGTPFDIDSLRRLIELKPNAIKIASCDFTNFLLIKDCAKYSLPMILSTGMSSETEIVSTNSMLNDMNVNRCFLHCNSTYPTPIEDINLNYINRMKDLTKSIIGFSSHSGDPIIPVSAAAIGAKIIELHVTSSRDSIGTDHSSSLLIEELKPFVENIKKISIALGNQNPRIPSQGELMNKVALGKSLCYKSNFKKGHSINPQKDLIGASPADGIQVKHYKLFKNKVLEKNVLKLEKLKKTDFEISFEDYKTSAISSLSSSDRKILDKYLWGIPVRYRDIVKFNEIFNPRLFEIHLSSKDLEFDLNKINIDKIKNKEIIIHSIEQFHDGFIFDLASSSGDIIKESFSRIDKILNHCDLIYDLLCPQNKIPIILNCGGFSRNSFLKENEINEKEKLLTENLFAIKSRYSDYEFLPQSMPPFPWHQGGRSFHNLLRSKESLKKLNKDTGLKICLDFSHTYMNCEFHNLCFIDEIKEIIDITQHMHLSDSSSSSNEGLNIGDGKIDFVKTFKLIYKDSIRNISFIPEVWQGHLNQGANFKLSLVRIANFLKKIID